MTSTASTWLSSGAVATFAVWLAPRRRATSSRVSLVSLTPDPGGAAGPGDVGAQQADRSGAGDQHPVPRLDPGLAGGHTPTESGSMSAAASSLRLSGTGCAREESRTTYWVNAPSTGGVAKNCTCGHRL